MIMSTKSPRQEGAGDGLCDCASDERPPGRPPRQINVQDSDQWKEALVRVCTEQASQHLPQPSVASEENSRQQLLSPSMSDSEEAADDPMTEGTPTYTKRVSLEQLSKVFHLPSKEAAKSLRVSCNLLKRTCRKHGILRWPQRKLLSLKNLTRAVQEDPNVCDDDRQVMVKRLTDVINAVMADPSHPVEKDMRELRQANYKQVYGGRHKDQGKQPLRSLAAAVAKKVTVTEAATAVTTAANSAPLLGNLQAKADQQPGNHAEQGVTRPLQGGLSSHEQVKQLLGLTAARQQQAAGALLQPPSAAALQFSGSRRFLLAPDGQVAVTAHHQQMPVHSQVIAHTVPGVNLQLGEQQGGLQGLQVPFGTIAAQEAAQQPVIRAPVSSHSSSVGTTAQPSGHHPVTWPSLPNHAAVVLNPQSMDNMGTAGLPFKHASVLPSQPGNPTLLSPPFPIGDMHILLDDASLIRASLDHKPAVSGGISQLARQQPTLSALAHLISSQENQQQRNSHQSQEQQSLPHQNHIQLNQNQQPFVLSRNMESVPMPITTGQPLLLGNNGVILQCMLPYGMQPQLLLGPMGPSSSQSPTGGLTPTAAADHGSLPSSLIRSQPAQSSAVPGGGLLPGHVVIQPSPGLTMGSSVWATPGGQPCILQSAALQNLLPFHILDLPAIRYT